MSCQEQIVRLLVVMHEENMHELTSFRFLKKPGIPEHKIGKNM